ncbi:MAG: ribosome biogenesis GTP-binding protein YihA/YsxC [Firmicutes bacterium]|nr:ribosome biogenesis GTP-binding protein YihA/YsxC [Bacillota bacterium]
MIIKSIDFCGSAVKRDQYPQDNLPQIVISGRSNVGKSSFINAMLNNYKIAKVSQTPGKTRLINFFLINSLFYFVDIPGYGYANVNKTMLMDFQTSIEMYLESSPTLQSAILLLDIRHIPTNDDLMMLEYFRNRNLNILLILTKADKLSNNQRFKQMKLIKERLSSKSTEKIFMFSATTKENRDLIWDEIEHSLIP